MRDERESEIYQLTSDDLDAAGDVLTAAFMDDPFFVYVIAEEGLRRKWLKEVMRACLESTIPEGHTCGITNDEGEIVGAILALPPGKYPPPLLKNLHFLWKMISRPSLFEPSLRQIWPGMAYARAWERMHFKGPHWYVFVLGVDPKWQGKGLGRQLMMSVIARAEADGLPVYLETQTESNVRFYRSLGFEVMETTQPAKEGPTAWGMLRMFKG